MNKKRGFVALPLLAPPGSFINTDGNMVESRTGHELLLQDNYITFTIEADPSDEQNRYMRKNRQIQFAYYISAYSIYGAHAFRVTLYDIVKAYAQSRNSTEIRLKVGGTKHYKTQVVYTLIVCAFVAGEDPLPGYPTLPLAGGTEGGGGEKADTKQEEILDLGQMLDEEGKIILKGAGKKLDNPKDDDEGDDEPPPLPPPPSWATNREAMPVFLPRNPCEAVNDSPTRYDALELAFHFPTPRFSMDLQEPERVTHDPKCCVTLQGSCTEKWPE